MKKDVDYIVKDGEILIVDDNTGRIMYGRRYSNGLHQAIEAKENVKIANESKTPLQLLNNINKLSEELAQNAKAVTTLSRQTKILASLSGIKI